ncbi:hypothetical protein [Mycolicibacterium arenosum]|uniref:Cysteine dioxygenase n=1 Tax=Mycolicibacterium arenosum TaxID=2952157 RepID=A0ABT1MCM3_9MYCO|nr:hypothetical protein [Mycolicibacterium sp. CAU 1645]MCP9276926.1 hypothetical protein [Mycolicibacterium sp. CAU 1645]
MSAVVSEPDTSGWLRTLLSGRPHQVVRNADGAYLHRWYLLPHNRFHNLYLHRFVQSDDDRALHDHPWAFVTVVLVGRYREVTECGVLERRPGAIARRRADHRHRVALLRDREGRERRCWTVVLTGPNVRTWGFWCPRSEEQDRFVPWRDFGAGGCGEAHAVRGTAS